MTSAAVVVYGKLVDKPEDELVDAPAVVFATKASAADELVALPTVANMLTQMLKVMTKLFLLLSISSQNGTGTLR